MAAALLAICGGDDSGSDGQSSGLVTKPVDTSKEAKRGGTNKWYLGAEPAGFDLHLGGAPKNTPKNLTVSNLGSAKPAILESRTSANTPRTLPSPGSLPRTAFR